MTRTAKYYLWAFTGAAFLITVITATTANFFLSLFLGIIAETCFILAGREIGYREYEEKLEKVKIKRD